MNTQTNLRAKNSEPGKGNIYKRGNEVIIKVTAQDTGGAYEVVEENCGPGFQSRAHIHTRNFETFYVMEGSADFQVGDELFHGTPGSCIHIPPGIPHQVTSKDGVRMLMAYSPGETEGMFADMHALSSEQLMDAKLTRAIAAKHNTVMIEKEPDGKGKGTVLG
ncbi:MAG: cupin domain-containing protein [Alphaproteobacteria bacterium]|nr:cupin domain-containing protein [Alphaproteobacteria bacterium]